jgi:8-oxo-dGTP pyrophosphatase MutT (NUDIX family)
MARAPVILHGDDDLLEVPAGCKDEVDPIEAVRREALEEAGLDLHSVEFVLRAWTMPAASTEQIGLYLARYEENSRVASGGGLQDEDEEMDVFEIPIAEVWAMYESGELKDMKTVVLIQALRLRYPELFE